MQRCLIWMRSEALWLGPVADLTSAPSDTCRVYLALDGPLLIEEAPVRRRLETGQALVVTGATAHRVDASGARAACFFLDRAVYDPLIVQTRLNSHAGRSWIISWLETFADPALALEKRPDRWAALFGPFAPPCACDPASLRLERGLRVVRRDPAAEHGLDRAAAAGGWSRSRFRHVVRQRAGVSLKRYRLWAKLARAVALTRKGRNLTEAALDAGFSSSSHLSAAHAAMFGMTPSAALRHLQGATLQMRLPPRADARLEACVRPEGPIQPRSCTARAA